MLFVKRDFLDCTFILLCLYYSADDNVMNDGTVNVILEDTEVGDCEADAEADDESIQYHLFAVDRSDNTVAYKVMHVSDSHKENNELSIATPVTNAVQVLASPLNGQFYVLSNDSDVVTSEPARTVAPRVTKLQLEGSQNVTTGIKKVNYLLFTIISAFYIIFLFRKSKFHCV